MVKTTEMHFGEVLLNGGVFCVLLESLIYHLVYDILINIFLLYSKWLFKWDIADNTQSKALLRS